MRLLSFVLLLTTVASCASAPLAQRVLVVYNARSRDSRKVAQYYMKARAIPPTNGCALQFPRSLEDEGRTGVPWEKLNAVVRVPVRKCVQHVGADKVLYIVLTYDTPYLITDLPQRTVGRAIDQYLADLWDETGGEARTRNPYFAAASAKRDEYPPFQTLADFREHLPSKRIYSVWRLDASTPKLAMGLVDKAIEAERIGLKGQACFDRTHPLANDMPEVGLNVAEWQLYRAAQFARKAGFSVLEDDSPSEFGTPPAPARCDNAALYCGWYSLNHYNDAFSWATGAIGWHLDSESATPRNGSNWGVNAVKKGITVTTGAVAEPYLDALVRPAGVVRNLLEGANVGDAFFRNTAWLKWMILNIGDPLYRPFSTAQPNINP